MILTVIQDLNDTAVPVKEDDTNRIHCGRKESVRDRTQIVDPVPWTQ